ncbi:hypothetical protein DYB28_003901 [Aphanomyces astaci]|uniref:Uncharacterized protein n=1 Tax=Aphanomyces astaci TaxID=112090 RepID=A0A9X8E815_APHAT|nr:hypothetical protein DYB28_003901 [Aphanomyces astaci]
MQVPSDGLTRSLKAALYRAARCAVSNKVEEQGNLLLHAYVSSANETPCCDNRIH